MEVLLFWLQAHFKWVVGMIAVVLVVAVLRSRVKKKRRKVCKTLRLRSAKEQARFNPVSISYNAKQYRRHRDEK